MWSGVKVKTAGALPVTVAELRGRLKIDGADEDAELAGFLAAAASEIEGPDGVGVALLAQTWTLTLDRFPAEITLPGWPVTGVSELRYLDPDGVEQVLAPATYRLAAGGDPARLVLQPGKTWPATLATRGAVAVDYTLGRASAADVDQGLITALCLMAGHYYENREATTPGRVSELPLGVSHILNRFRRGVAG